MQTVRADFFIGNVQLGTASLPKRLQIKSGFYDAAQTTAFFCSKCGDIWARIIVEGDPDFKITTRLCAKHGSGLLQRGVGELWQYYPREVLTREVAILGMTFESNPELDLTDLVYRG